MDKSTFFNPDLLLPPAHLLLHSAWHSGTVLLSNCNKLLMLDKYILKFKIHFFHLHKTFKKSLTQGQDNFFLGARVFISTICLVSPHHNTNTEEGS